MTAAVGRDLALNSEKKEKNISTLSGPKLYLIKEFRICNFWHGRLAKLKQSGTHIRARIENVARNKDYLCENCGFFTC